LHYRLDGGGIGIIVQRTRRWVAGGHSGIGRRTLRDVDCLRKLGVAGDHGHVAMGVGRPTESVSPTAAIGPSSTPR
jgi:hypothetical protein